MDKNNQESKDDPIELMRLIACKTDNESAEAAFTVFHALYVKLIRYMSLFYYKKFEVDDSGIVDEIASNALYKVWENAGKFKVDPLLKKKDKEKKLQSWIWTIVRNEFFLYLRAQHKSHVIPRSKISSFSTLDEKSDNEEEYEWNMDKLPEIQDEPYDPAAEDAYHKKHKTELKAIQKHLKSLPKAHKKVFDTYLTFGDESGKLPPGMFQDLCKKTGLHKEYPKKIKMRVMGDLKDLFKGDKAI
jgi:DNA-directed RNA polymerase specialized sigma24 family protein